MKNILVINGDCIQTNSSANLCHLAYLNGLVDLGYSVTLLSADTEGYIIDPSIIIPSSIIHITYKGMTLYEKMSSRKKQNAYGRVTNNAKSESKGPSKKQSFISGLSKLAKQKVLRLYGMHGIYSKFVRKAQRFRSSVVFDYVISISTPVSSHLIAYNLLKSKHIKTNKWIQIWEDPWSFDVYGSFNKKTFNEEKRLLSVAERVCYVSPLTLINQQNLFPKMACKMYWQPLPYYYKNTIKGEYKDCNLLYGYFGFYYTRSRDLSHFYQAARDTRIELNICGEPSSLFESTEKISIYPRLPLEKLKPIEDKTDILVFLCNRKGGQIPGKIYQYSATYKTILFILDGTDEEKKVLKEYFQKFNRYVFCENTVEDITRAINDIENGNIGNVVNEPVEAFNPKKTVRKILACENG